MNNPPIAIIDERFCSPHPVSLLMKEKIFSCSGEDFHIRDANTGDTVFSIEEKFFSLSERKKLNDHQGIPIAHFKYNMRSFLPSFFIYQGKDDSTPISKIAQKFTFLKTKMKTSVINRATGESIVITMKSDGKDKKTQIYIGEQKQGGQ